MTDCTKYEWRWLEYAVGSECLVLPVLLSLFDVGVEAVWKGGSKSLNEKWALK